MKKIFTVIFSIFFLYLNNANSAISDWKENESKGAKTRIIASFYQDQNNQKKLIAGIEFKIASGWKIYGQGSDTIGLPPSFDFSQSKNYLQHKIIWPQAEAKEEKIADQIFKYSIYHDSVILPIELELSNPTESFDIKVKMIYGLCKDVCIPAEENFTLAVASNPDFEALDLIQKFYPQKISTTFEKAAETSKSHYSFSLIYWIFLAILGGAILNIMPCVLPVLSIKLLSIIKHSDARISQIRFAFFSTILGILFCFLVFAICAITIKLAGNSFGWGFQFQNPYFLILLILVLTIFTANMLGIFEISFDRLLVNFLNKKINESLHGKKRIFIPNFLSGILAVLLATPCSAPILGSAISFALTQNLLVILIIFFSIGLGVAAPYFILIASPKLVYLLPKPGNWMLQVKKIMAFLLALTIVWLAVTLSDNIGMIQALVLLILAALLILCFEIKFKFIKFLAIITIAATCFAIPRYSATSHPQEISKNQLWLNFDEKLIHQLVMQNKVVIVDVTADWCLTCKINKLTVLNNDEVVKKLHDPNIVAMRADITKPNMEVLEYLRRHNRFAIPFNAVYGPNAKNGLLTSELLTKKELLKLIEQAQTTNDGSN
ncbi:MAG: protein-disulfide reductase DsbD family protein [Rickettsiales bacterium]|nr:protein-disulfide reductase DsbD family protein [Rickettsiales bacterium]